MNWKKGILISILILIVGFLSLVIYNKINFNESIQSLNINNIDISKVVNGKFTGQFKLSYISAKVAVVVENGSISSVEILEHIQERGKKAESIIIKQVLTRQSLDVDTVTGATASSKVILKAIEIALQTGKV